MSLKLAISPNLLPFFAIYLSFHPKVVYTFNLKETPYLHKVKSTALP